MARLPRRNVAIEVHDRSERQIVTFDLIADDEPLNRRRKIEMPADHAFMSPGSAIRSSPRPANGWLWATPKNKVRSLGFPNVPGSVSFD